MQQQVHAATILMWQAIITGEGSSRLGVFSSVRPLSFFNTLLRIVGSTMWLFLTPLTCPPCWPFLFSGLHMGPFLLFLVFPLFWVLCLSKVWHGLITWLNRVPRGTYPNETRKNPWSQTSNTYFLAVLAGQLTRQNISSAERRAVPVYGKPLVSWKALELRAEPEVWVYCPDTRAFRGHYDRHNGLNLPILHVFRHWCFSKNGHSGRFCLLLSTWTMLRPT